MAALETQTEYPIRLVVKTTSQDGSIPGTLTIDQFQWNSDLSPENVEPEIPADCRALK